MKHMRLSILGGVPLLGLSFSLMLVLGLPVMANALSFTFTTSNQSYTMPWAPAGTPYAGVLQLDVTNFTSSSATLAITITNTSDISFGNVLTTFGTDLQNVTGISFTSGTYFTKYKTGNVNTSGGYRVDFCAFTSNNCSGGNFSSALMPGMSDTFYLGLTGTFGSGFSLDDPVVKYQNLYDGTSQTFLTTPEPSSGALFFTGLILLGLWRYRNRLKI